MAQRKRVVAVGCPHHITQRGNFRRDVFYDDEDRSAYLDLLARYSGEAQLEILRFPVSGTGAKIPRFRVGAAASSGLFV